MVAAAVEVILQDHQVDIHPAHLQEHPAEVMVLHFKSATNVKFTKN